MKRGKFVGVYILVFLLALGAGVVSKFVIKPACIKKYQVKWSDEIGRKITDVSYGVLDSNTFDLYLPKNDTKENYGLVVYLHAGGFTMGDKADDEGMLSWLTSKGYVACGINYTLRNESNNANVLQQSNEIKAAIPVVIEEAKKQGYNVNEMVISGGSAGHALAMIYAYRDGEEAPVPVKMTFGAVGPSSFYVEDWDIYGFDQDTDETRKAAAGLFGIMGGVKLTVDMIKDGSYLELMKPVSASMWINKNSVPTVVVYGRHDKVQPYKASQRLRKALQDNHIDYKYFEATHSGHGLQNDNDVYCEYLQAVEEYLDKYIPVD